mmetsp:Transcript_5475/g.12045  ORF Transcript_5475/g.12045 Transcript_5475/m.12045 type:complete len:230 (-) Transcript_5475:171-860(-)
MLRPLRAHQRQRILAAQNLAPASVPEDVTCHVHSTEQRPHHVFRRFSGGAALASCASRHCRTTLTSLHAAAMAVSWRFPRCRYCHSRVHRLMGSWTSLRLHAVGGSVKNPSRKASAGPKRPGVIKTIVTGRPKLKSSTSARLAPATRSSVASNTERHGTLQFPMTNSLFALSCPVSSSSQAESKALRSSSQVIFALTRRRSCGSKPISSFINATTRPPCLPNRWSMLSP